MSTSGRRPSKHDVKGLQDDKMQKRNKDDTMRKKNTDDTMQKRNMNDTMQKRNMDDTMQKRNMDDTMKKRNKDDMIQKRNTAKFDEGPVTSTPKKRPPSTRNNIPDDYSIIVNDTSVEDSEYWNEIQDAIDKWLSGLPVSISAQNREMIKQEMATEIADREQYLQLNPKGRKSSKAECKDLVYQVFRRLNKFLEPDEMKVAIEAGDELMMMMKEVPDTRAHDTSAEQDLHQEIKEVISTTIPVEVEEDDASAEEQDTLEIMKLELADAFIKLNYTGGNCCVRNKLKNKIKDELDRFCNDYLTKHPGKPLCREKLSRDLYKALKKVQPPEDVMQSTVEYVKTKDVVEDWVKGLPLEEQTPTQILDMKRNIGDLAKKLRDLEHNVDSLDDSQDIENKKEEEITRFLETVPLIRNQFTRQLIEKLKATERARQVDGSTKYSITADDFTATDLQICSFSDSSLSKEDLDCLERLRQRSCISAGRLSNKMKSQCKSQTDVGGGIGFQTPPFSGLSSNDCSRVPGRGQDYSSTMDSMGTCDRGAGNSNCQPQVAIKDYWDSSNLIELQSKDCPRSGSKFRRRCVPSIRPLYDTTSCSREYSCSREPYPMKYVRSTFPKSCSHDSKTCRSHQPYNASGTCVRDSHPRPQIPEYSNQRSRKGHAIGIGSLDHLMSPIAKRSANDTRSCTRNTNRGYRDNSRIDAASCSSWITDSDEETPRK